MKGLKCTTHNCEHNVCCHCYAGVIDVSKSGVCKTKQKREYGILEQNKINIEAGMDFDYAENQDVLIQCDATDCLYNRNRLCSGRVVNISDAMFRTKCFTKKNR